MSGRRRTIQQTILFATAASLLAHVVVAELIIAALAFGRPPYAEVTHSRRDEVVAISRSINIEHRPAPRPVRRFESALSKFDLQMRGRRARLRRGQGYYEPLSSWRVNGVRYYRVAYAFVFRDGAYESGVVPWPVRFATGADPFVRPDPSRRIATPLPPPPPDFMPPGTLGKALRAYFPQFRFED